MVQGVGQQVEVLGVELEDVVQGVGQQVEVLGVVE